MAGVDNSTTSMCGHIVMWPQMFTWVLRYIRSWNR
jgi:hypothetical protein